ncbi:hypothetical protein DFP74_2858 [Nocardiopsis sp. Huas11]|nr:hypothetical protein DFP74_2858 [Nocardiopsis sp. Huas11]
MPAPTLHQSRILRTPQGSDVPIDGALVPFISRLWGMGMRTRSSCQDYGDLLAMSVPGLPAGDQRWIDFYKGRVWVELEAGHAEQLVGLLSRDRELHMALAQWGLPESWTCVRPILPDLTGGPARTAPSAHLFFPRSDVKRVVGVLEQLDGPAGRT